jgi:hypothetical protein
MKRGTQTIKKRKAKRQSASPRPKPPGRRPTDPDAPLPPTISVQAGAKRYKIGRDQMYSAVKAKEVPAIFLNGKFRIVVSKADELFGLLPPPVPARTLTPA